MTDRKTNSPPQGQRTKPTSPGTRAPSPGQAPAGRPGTRAQSGSQGGQPRATQIKPGEAKAKPQPNRTKMPAAGPAPQTAVSMLHGAEALAALTVAESKLSRLKGKFILGLTLLLCLSLAWNSIQSASRPEPKLLAMTTDGRVQPLPLLDEPLDSRQTLFDWVRRNIPSLYDFNYANYQSQIGKARDFTQPITLETFQEDLLSSGILSKVTEEFLILRANIVQEPLITSETTVNGRRLWVVEVPMNLVYDSGEVRDGQRRRLVQEVTFQAWIVRASILEYDGGLMLAKYSVKSRRN